MEKMNILKNRVTIIENFFGEGDSLYADQLGWSKREKYLADV